MSPARVVLDIGPQEPDATERFGAVGAGFTAKELLQAHSELYSPELARLQAQPAVPYAEEVIDLDEVERVAKPPGEVQGAQLRGDLQRPSSLVVTYVFIGESGRSGRGVLSWDSLPTSKAAYENARDKRLFGTTLLTPSGEEHEREAFSAAQVQELRDELQRVRGELAEAQDPQPFEGYADAKATDIVAEARSRDLNDPEQFVATEQLLDYERRHKDRETVVGAVEKLLDEQRESAQGENPDGG